MRYIKDLLVEKAILPSSVLDGRAEIIKEEGDE